MWGFSVWGVPTWGVNDASHPVGDVYSPAPAIIEWSGGPAPLVSGTNAIETFSMIREVLRSAGSGGTEVETFSMIRETLRTSSVGGTEINTFSLIRETLRSSAIKTGNRRASLM